MNAALPGDLVVVRLGLRRRCALRRVPLTFTDADGAERKYVRVVIRDSFIYDDTLALYVASHVDDYQGIGTSKGPITFHQLLFETRLVWIRATGDDAIDDVCLEQCHRALPIG